LFAFGATYKKGFVGSRTDDEELFEHDDFDLLRRLSCARVIDFD
jgi:hypothetical protein